LLLALALSADPGPGGLVKEFFSAQRGNPTKTKAKTVVCMAAADTAVPWQGRTNGRTQQARDGGGALRSLFQIRGEKPWF